MKAVKFLYLRTLGILFAAVGLLCALLLALSLALPISASDTDTYFDCTEYDSHGNCVEYYCDGDMSLCLMMAIAEWTEE